jgi:hypothetical protein
VVPTASADLICQTCGDEYGALPLAAGPP